MSTLRLAGFSINLGRAATNPDYVPLYGIGWSIMPFICFLALSLTSHRLFYDSMSQLRGFTAPNPANLQCLSYRLDMVSISVSLILVGLVAVAFWLSHVIAGKYWKLLVYLLIAVGLMVFVIDSSVSDDARDVFWQRLTGNDSANENDADLILRVDGWFGYGASLLLFCSLGLLVGRVASKGVTDRTIFLVGRRFTWEVLCLAGLFCLSVLLEYYYGSWVKCSLGSRWSAELDRLRFSVLIFVGLRYAIAAGVAILPIFVLPILLSADRNDYRRMSTALGVGDFWKSAIAIGSPLLTAMVSKLIEEVVKLPIVT